jgi:hypothetical protein
VSQPINNNPKIDNNTTDIVSKSQYNPIKTFTKINTSKGKGVNKLKIVCRN